VTLQLPFDTALFDVDGTLIDSNDAHAEAWAQALREHGIACDVATIRRLVGMGGDKLLPRVAQLEEDSPEGRAITARKKTLFGERVPSLRPTRGARALVEFLRNHEVEVVIATSAGDDEMKTLLRQAGVDDLLPLRTSKDDAADSKPDPDIVHAAMQRARARAETTVMIGDTPYDIEAATRARVRTIALRSGGYWGDDDLRGAAAIYDDPAALLVALQTATATAAVD
jgi:phosphoglycolate phosphatase-like HAD superfamily hydrolase